MFYHCFDLCALGKLSDLYDDQSTFEFFQAILLFGGIPFLWDAAGRVIGTFGYSSEYEVIIVLGMK